MKNCEPMKITSIARPQRGITMVESLVALVVLAVGMLGIASLYVASLKAGRSALIRTQAVNLVNDMVDRIRANAPARTAYDMSNYGSKPQEHGCVATSNCTAAELAEDDLARWQKAVQATLPGGNNVVANVTVFPAAAGGQPDRYHVRVEWREPGEEANFSYDANLHLIPPIT